MSRKRPNAKKEGHWKEAKATPAQQEEIDKLCAEKKAESIKGKQVEFIQMQRDYREMFLMVNLKGVSLTELKNRLDHHDEVFKGTDNAMQVSPDIEWIDAKYPAPILKAKYNLEVFNYGEMITKQNQLKDGLLNYQLTEQQINDIVVDNKYVKELPPQPEPVEENIELIEEELAKVEDKK